MLASFVSSNMARPNYVNGCKWRFLCPGKPIKVNLYIPTIAGWCWLWADAGKIRETSAIQSPEKKRLGVRHFAEVQLRLVEIEVQFGSLALQRHLVPPMALMAHDGSDASPKRPFFRICFWLKRDLGEWFLWDFRWFREIPEVGWENLFGNEWMDGMILWWLLMFWRTGVFAGG